MSRREAWFSAVGVLLVALAVRAWAASLIVFPKPEDTAYYVSVARNLVEGRGLVSDAIWSFQTPPLVFPRPAFEVWLPLPTWLAAIPMALFGPTFRSAQLMSILAGALVAVLAWRLAADVATERQLPVGRARALAVGTGVTAAVYLPLILHSTLPDSTALFGLFVLAGCLLMTRLVPNGAWTPGLILLGVVIGLAALTRNDAIWLAVTWLAVAWRMLPGPRTERLRAIAVPAVVALLVFLPWMVRDWAAFGSPLPGQAAANALSLNGSDIFAWSDPPTLGRYLSAGLGRLVELRAIGFAHDLFDVLLFLGVPIAILGLVALPWFTRARSLRPLVVFSTLTFAATTLLFPVSTTWGTFLHAAAAIHVLLLVTALQALDALVSWVGRRRGWTRPVAWLGPAFAVAASILFTVVLLPTFGNGSQFSAARYAAMPGALASAGVTVRPENVVLADNPIWVADSLGARAVAVPDESPASVRSLASYFGARLLLLSGGVVDAWPAVLASNDPDADCFRPLTLPLPADHASREALEGVRAWEISCP
jgi:Dolichyl-phosphate-mannose-protein mannosyltransferase